MQVGDKTFQLERVCFGLNTLGYLRMQVMHVFLKKGRKQGVLVFVYLDYILLVAEPEVLATQQRGKLLQDPRDSGMTISYKKSQLTPTQQIQFLDFPYT